MEIEEGIHQLEDGIRRLKVQYDLFFSGASPRPPVELRAQVDRLIRTFANASIRRYSDRFLFNTLVGRYNSFIELWNKQQRVLDEGRDRPGLPHLFSARTPAPDAAEGEVLTNGAAHRASISTVPAQTPAPDRPCVLRGEASASDSAALETLFERYVEARRQISGTAPRLTLDSFARQIGRQADALRASSGCDAVEFRLTAADSQVTIKARPASAGLRAADPDEASDPDHGTEGHGGPQPAGTRPNSGPAGPR